MITIQQLIQHKLDSGMKAGEIATELKLSPSMISQYSDPKGGYKASLNLALRVYEDEGIALHPFSAESLKYEINKTKKGR